MFILNYPELYLLVLPTLWFVRVYNGLDTDSQRLNHRIIGNVCGWNLMHTVAFWCISSYLKPISFWNYSEIGGFMVAWYWIEKKFFSRIHVGGDNYTTDTSTSVQDIVYSNPYQPRLDDFIFNWLGVLIYVYT